ncbi:MAG: putative radical SAM superfamily Fe-S cluster-containing enzyme, partial [Myxococcota bacterium]
MGLLRTLLSDTITDTTGYCPECEQLVPGQIVEHSDTIWLRRRCPVHGQSDAMQSRHPRHFRMMEAMLEPLPDPVLEHDIEHAQHLRGLFIDVTEACNLRCPNCLIDAKNTVSGIAPTLEETIEQLRAVLPYKPVLYLTGGEPTLLKDLPRWVSTLTGLGYDVKLLSNGIKLQDFDYCKTLYDAGCRWILLQTDTMDIPSLYALRGRKDARTVRETAIDNLVRLGMNIDLACMIDRNFNYPHMGDL